MRKDRAKPRKQSLPSTDLPLDGVTGSGAFAAHGAEASGGLALPLSSQRSAGELRHAELGGLSGHWGQPHDEFEEARLDYILVDLDECLTFANIVETEYRTGDREHAGRTLAAIEECYADMLRCYQAVDGLESDTRAGFETKFMRVKQRLEGVRRLVGAT